MSDITPRNSDSHQNQHPASDGGTSPTPAPDAGGAAALVIDVISDVVCPWCFVGKRQLEQAIDGWREAHPQAEAPVVNWHAFQLNPDLPLEGMSRADYLTRKFGSADTSRIYTNVRRAAAEVGLELKLDGIARQPSTLRAHALLRQAAQQGCQDALAEALFNGYFIENRDLTDVAELRRIAAAAGLAASRIDAALDDPNEHALIAEDDAQARDNGITGVPFFIINRKLAVSGAAGAAHLRAAIDQALEA